MLCRKYSAGTGNIPRNHKPYICPEKSSTKVISLDSDVLLTEHILFYGE